jgi:[protein-PII] uridylyltransferase
MHAHGLGTRWAKRRRMVVSESVVPLSPKFASAAAQNLHAGPGWQWHRDRLRRLLEQKPSTGVSAEEVAAHFDNMPPRYWERVTEDELTWGLQTVHRFFNHLAANDAPATTAVMDARHFPQQGCTKVLVCTWDGVGLLTRLAGYMTALRMNVLRAQVYTRADDVVLDVFWLCDQDGKHIRDAERLKKLEFLLEGGLSNPPRFASQWAPSAHKYLPRPRAVAPVVAFNNTESVDRTIITVEAAERIGLLHDILEALTLNRLNISEALIDTVDDIARDVFFVTDDYKAKITDAEKLAAIKSSVVEALTS